MNKRKTLQELTIKDNFMFAAVMMDPKNCKGMLERVLDMPIERVTVIPEKSIIYHPEYKGIRLDVLAKDEHNTHFNVEMQVASRKLLKRARYYHSQIDMELLASGAEYEELPDSYVIFICDFDLFHLGKYKYTIRQNVLEAPDYKYSDGTYTIFLNTKGSNESEVSRQLVDFLKFVETGTSNNDTYVQQCQQSIEHIKNDREMGARFMLLEEMMRDERKAGKAEGIAIGEARGEARGIFIGKSSAIIEILSAKGFVSDALRSMINQVSDSDKLSELLSAAVKAKSIEEFENIFSK